MSKVAVVIPNHKDKLSEVEKISLAQCRKVLGCYPLIHAVPAGKNFSYFAPGDMVVHFPEEYFRTLRSYNNLSISSLFYEPFAYFDYILIYQLDAFVFYDALEEFCALGYDYIGAPWPYYTWQRSRKPKTPRVGNGGFCLRKVKACHKLLTEAESLPNWLKARERYTEDTFFATCGVMSEDEFNVAPVVAAQLFSMEWNPARHVKKLGGLPFGCHGWTKFGADFYVETFRQFGYDLRPLREQMGSADYLEQLPMFLTKVAMNRLIRQIEGGQSILRYLPTKRFASIRVIRSPAAMKILAQLLAEDNFLADEIFICNEETWTDLPNDLPRADLPHLIIVADYDVSLIAAVEKCGLRYDEHVISFQREYIKHCEKLFHKLGK